MTIFFIIIGILVAVILIARAANNPSRQQQSSQLDDIIKNTLKDIFPNGEADIKSGTDELLRILNYRIDAKTARDIFIKSSSICYITSQKDGFSVERLKQHLAPYALHYFSDNALSKFYFYLISKNKTAAFFEVTKMYAQQFYPPGTDRDEMPEGYGEFGLEYNTLILFPLPLSPKVICIWKN